MVNPRKAGPGVVSVNESKIFRHVLRSSAHKK